MAVSLDELSTAVLELGKAVLSNGVAHQQASDLMAALQPMYNAAAAKQEAAERDKGAKQSSR